MPDPDSNVRRLRSLPAITPAALLGLPCKRPTCSNTAELDHAGRPSEFCARANGCQRLYQAERKRALRQLRDAAEVARRYEWDVPRLDPPSTAGRQPDTATSSNPEQGPQQQPPPQPVNPEPSTTPSVADAPSTLLPGLLHDVGLAAAALQIECSRQDASDLSAQALNRLVTARDRTFQALAKGQT